MASASEAIYTAVTDSFPNVTVLSPTDLAMAPIIV